MSGQKKRTGKYRNGRTVPQAAEKSARTAERIAADTIPAGTAGEAGKTAGKNLQNRIRSSAQKIRIDRGTLRYAFLSLLGLILFTWALVNTKTLVDFIKKFFALFTPLFGGCGIAYIVNVIMNPLEKLWMKLDKKQTKFSKKLRRPVCMIVSTLLILGLIFAVVFMMIPGLRSSVGNLVDSLPVYVNEITVWWGNLVDLAAKYKITLPEYVIDSSALIDKVTALFEEKGNGIISGAVGATTSILSAAINVILSLVVAMYLLGKKERIGSHLTELLYAVLPEEKAVGFLRIVKLCDRTFSGFIGGQSIEAIIIGVLCFIGMKILKLPYAAVISVLISFTALIPIIGAWIGACVGAFLILLVKPIQAVWFVIFLLILQQLEGNLIYPKVVGKMVDLPGLLVLLSVTIGGDAFGFLGMLLGVPVCAVLYSLYKEFVAKKSRARAAEKAAAETEAEVSALPSDVSEK